MPSNQRPTVSAACAQEHPRCWGASKAPTESRFHSSMNKLKANKEASWKGLNDTPHKLWANYAGRGNMTWNQSTSSMSETVNSMIGAKTRAKPAMFMRHDIVPKTANRMATASSASVEDSSVVPIAQETSDTELQWSNKLKKKLIEVFDLMDPGYRL